MKKTIMLIIAIILSLSFVACNEDVPEIENFTFELVGDDIVYIEEDFEYIEQGVLVDGEFTYAGYQSNVDTSKVGTYYVEFMHIDKTLMRTVIVTKGAKSYYTEMIEELENATSYTYKMNLDISYNRNEQYVSYYRNESYDVYGDYLFGTWGTNLFDFDLSEEQYIFIDHQRGVKERYIVNQNGFSYSQQDYYETSNTCETEFVLDYFSYTTRELIDGQYVYSVYLKPGAYDHGYFNSINYFEGTSFYQMPEDPLNIFVYTEDNHIVKIVIDLSQIITEALSIPTTISEISYIYTYEFSNINELEPIVIPPGALLVKNQ